MTISERRHDIDWVRVIAIGLLIIYHVAIGFQPWGIYIGFIQNADSNTDIWIPMSMLNVWRIPLLFFVSGMGVCFALKRRNWKALIGERFKRIMIPFLIGTTAIVPLHVMLWQNYYNQSISYVWHPYHLWFLGNIFIYVLVLSPIFFYLKNQYGKALHLKLQKLFSHPIVLVLIAIPFVIEALVINPTTFETYALTWHGFTMGLLAFFFGFIFVYSGEGFWNMLVKWRYALLVAAFGLYLFRYISFDLNAPNYLKAVESCFWIFTVLGFGKKHLNKPSHSLTYLSQAAYPVYILHMFFLYLAAWLLFPLDVHVVIKFVISILFTGAGSILTYEYVIRRVDLLRVFFGLRKKKETLEKNQSANTSTHLAKATEGIH